MKGNLRDIGLADLIQQNCLDHKTAKLTVKNNQMLAEIYFKDGQVVHAQMNNQVGEPVIYPLLTWQEGEFELQTGKEAPTTTVNRSWSAILIEGARLIDEKRAEAGANTAKTTNYLDQLSSLQELLANLSQEVSGYMASAVASISGACLAFHSTSFVNPSIAIPSLTLLLKMVTSTVDRVAGGTFEDEIIVTERAYILVRALSQGRFYLVLVADRKNASMGNMRLAAKSYTHEINLEDQPVVQSCVHISICPVYSRKVKVKDPVYNDIVAKYCQAKFEDCEIFYLIDDVIRSGVPLSMYLGEIQSMVPKG